jgi:hypothetical protein
MNTMTQMTPLEGLRAQLARTRTQRRNLAALDLEGEGRLQRLAEMDEMIRVLEVELGLAEAPEPDDELARLRRERPPLAVRVLAGDDAARDELDDLDARIADAERTRELEALAGEERERLEREAAREAERLERERREHELQETLERRHEIARNFERRIIAACELLPDFLAADVEAYNLGVGLRRTERRMAEQLAEIVLVHLSDFGLDSDTSGGALPYVRVSVRPETLTEREPVEQSGEPVEPEGDAVTVAACSICGHPARLAIEADLADGVTLRALQERYGVSRSALSRHKRHNGSDEPEPAA